MSSQCQGILTNPDVTGIGVCFELPCTSFNETLTHASSPVSQIRIYFYVSILLIAIVPETPYTMHLLNWLQENLNTNGLGLIVISIVQTFQGKLSLYDAILIQHMLFFFSIGIAPRGKRILLCVAVC